MLVVLILRGINNNMNMLDIKGMNFRSLTNYTNA